MATTNRGVAAAWMRGESARSHNGNFSTDGANLWSYYMLIGRTLADGTKQVLNLYSPNRVSVTTTMHVSHASHAGARMVNPIPSWGNHGFSFPP